MYFLKRKVGAGNQKNEKEKDICPGFMRKPTISVTFTGFEYKPIMQDAVTEMDTIFDIDEVTSLETYESCNCVSEAQNLKAKHPSQNNVVIDSPVESIENDERLEDWCCID